MAVHTKHRYLNWQVEAMLRATGFEPLVITYANFFTFPAVAVVRLAQRALKLFAAEVDDVEHKSDLNPLPETANNLLTGILKVEASLVTRVSLPFGSSVTAMARAV